MIHRFRLPFLGATLLALALAGTARADHGSSHSSHDMAGHGAQAGNAAQAEQGAQALATSGDLVIESGFARAMLPGAKVGGAYLTIRNAGTAPDRLLSVASPAAATASLHTMRQEDGVMRMRAIEGGLAIPAGATVALSPGGDHLMLENVATPFRQGEMLNLTLFFERAGAVAVSVPIGAPDARGANAHAGH